LKVPIPEGLRLDLYENYTTPSRFSSKSSKYHVRGRACVKKLFISPSNLGRGIDHVVNELVNTPKEITIEIKQCMGVRSIIKGIDYHNDSNRIKKEDYCIFG
jgi:hypothetical protein